MSTVAAATAAASVGLLLLVSAAVRSEWAHPQDVDAFAVLPGGLHRRVIYFSDVACPGGL